MNFSCMLLAACVASVSLTFRADAQDTSAIKDRQTIAPWAIPAIEHLNQAKVVAGYPDGEFRPNRLLTRSELAWAIYALQQHTRILSDTENNRAASALMAVFSPPETKWEMGVFKTKDGTERFYR